MRPLKRNASDEYTTPPWVLDYLQDWVEPGWTVLEAASGHHKGLLEAMTERGWNAMGVSESFDFLANRIDGWDCIITNPPYTLTTLWLRRCYALGKPFALLLPLSALETELRQECYREHGLSLICLPQRVHYGRPDGQPSRAHQASAWFTWKPGMDKSIIIFR